MEFTREWNPHGIDDKEKPPARAKSSSATRIRSVTRRKGGPNDWKADEKGKKQAFKKYAAQKQSAANERAANERAADEREAHDEEANAQEPNEQEAAPEAEE
jgi:hypothetical protein